MLDNLACFLSSADFFRVDIFDKLCQNATELSNSPDPDQACKIIGADMAPYC